MSKGFLLFLFLLFSIPGVFAQAPPWQWAKNGTGGGGLSDGAIGVVCDSLGNVYITGGFASPSITFGAFTLTNSFAGKNDIFLVKYDSFGNPVWARSAGGTDWDFGTSLALGPGGGVYVTGDFGSASLTFGSTTVTNTNPTARDLFVARYDSSGNPVWATSGGGMSDEQTPKIASDNSGNVFITGRFRSPMMIFGSDTLINIAPSTNNIFFIKYDQAGNILWAQAPKTSYSIVGSSVTTDSFGNVYLAGHFSDTTVTLGGITLYNSDSIYSNHKPNMLLYKFDPSGNAIWATNQDGSTLYPYCITGDALGNTYLTGMFSEDSVIFGSEVLTNIDTSGSGTDVFICKYDPSGNVLWARSGGGVTYNDLPRGIAVNASGVYATGCFQGPTIQFNSTILNNAVSTGASYDTYLVKYDLAGNLLWGKRIGGPNNDEPNSMTCNELDNLYSAGYFNSPSLAFDATILNNAGSIDFFLAKLGSSTVEIGSLQDYSGILIFPNPFSTETTIEFEQDQNFESIKLMDICGKELKRFDCSETRIPLSRDQLKSGIYFIQAKDDLGRLFTNKIIVQ